MTDEEIVIIKNLNKIKEGFIEKDLQGFAGAIQSAINLIKKLTFDIEVREQVHDYDVKMIDEVKGEYVKMVKEKDKIIHEMAKAWKQDDERSIENIIEYFEKKVGE